MCRVEILDKPIESHNKKDVVDACETKMNATYLKSYFENEGYKDARDACQQKVDKECP